MLEKLNFEMTRSIYTAREADLYPDRAFSMGQYNSDAALIARGINPYSENDETLFGQETSLPKVERAPRFGRATKIDYDVFGRLVEGTSLEPRNPFAHIDVKRRILRRSGYTHLTGKDSERVTLDSAKDHRVGLAFQNTYSAYKRRTGN